MPVAALMAGLPVAIVGDTCRDPFHAHGDPDMPDSRRQSARMPHPGHPIAGAPALEGPIPTPIMSLGAGAIRPVPGGS